MAFEKMTLACGPNPMGSRRPRRPPRPGPARASQRRLRRRSHRSAPARSYRSTWQEVLDKAVAALRSHGLRVSPNPPAPSSLPSPLLTILLPLKFCALCISYRKFWSFLIAHLPS
ncbi:hypothetical protein GUJ93_ZPchr0458g22640 [Zizania palustris]|uniref:Uncharacterized protein n=1 Tax=Zizania palustris TaxID=103762 RepID=A0A8J5QZV2_ZIZPA|nr:hypothetical protein GUJ93_ZPchr0458g22640 [Zizania palustris]